MWAQLIPMIIGMIMSKQGSSKAGSVDNNSTADVPDHVRPYLDQLLSSGLQTFQSNLLQGTPITDASKGEMEKTLRGDYLDPRTNPYLKETFQEASNRVKAAMSPNFGHMQAFGPNAGANEAMTRANSELATNLYGANYNQERGRQFEASMFGPQWQTGATGSTFAPFDKFGSMLRGWGDRRWNNHPYFENKGGNMLGGALAGMQLGRMFGGNSGGGGGGFDWGGSGGFGGGGSYA